MTNDPVLCVWVCLCVGVSVTICCLFGDLLFVKKVERRPKQFRQVDSQEHQTTVNDLCRVTRCTTLYAGTQPTKLI